MAIVRADDAARRLSAVGALIERIRRAGIAAPVEGPDFRGLAEIAAAADGAGAQVVALGPGGRFRVAGGTMPVHPMAGGIGLMGQPKTKNQKPTT